MPVGWIKKNPQISLPQIRANTEPFWGSYRCKNLSGSTGLLNHRSGSALKATCLDAHWVPSPTHRQAQQHTEQPHISSRQVGEPHCMRLCSCLLALLMLTGEEWKVQLLIAWAHLLYKASVALIDSFWVRHVQVELYYPQNHLFLASTESPALCLILHVLPFIF